jgi:hypothetical protein
MNNELVGVWKEASVTYFEVPSRNLLERIEGSHKSPVRQSMSLPEPKSETIPTEPACSVHMVANIAKW